VQREEKKRGKVWCYSGVVLAFYRGRGSTGEGWLGRLTSALMALTPLKTGEDLRGKLREGKSRRGGNGSVAPEAQSWAALGGWESVAVRASSGG
jgi:hypothetical protein